MTLHVDVGRVAMASRYVEIGKIVSPVCSKFATSQLFQKVCFHLPFCEFTQIFQKPPQASGSTFLRIMVFHRLLIRCFKVRIKLGGWKRSLCYMQCKIIFPHFHVEYQDTEFLRSFAVILVGKWETFDAHMLHECLNCLNVNTEVRWKVVCRRQFKTTPSNLRESWGGWLKLRHRPEFAVIG